MVCLTNPLNHLCVSKTRGRQYGLNEVYLHIICSNQEGNTSARVTTDTSGTLYLRGEDGTPGGNFLNGSLQWKKLEYDYQGSEVHSIVNRVK